MTTEEIKQTVSMRDVLSRYGVQVRGNMCCCPIHGERHPSMKVFKDGYKCFACNSNGDIFKFVQEMEKCDFKTAFTILGGTYKQAENKTQRKLIQNKYERQKTEKKKKEDFEIQFRKRLENAIFKCRDLIPVLPAYHSDWCTCQNWLPYLEYAWDVKYLREESINKADVIRVCKRIECL